MPGVEMRRWPNVRLGLLARLMGRRLADYVARRYVDARLRALWRSSRCDLCHVQWIDRRAYDAAESGLRPLVLTAWGSDLNWLDAPADPGGDRERVGLALRRAALVIVDSSDLVAVATRIAGAPLTTLLLPIGIDTRRFRPGFAREAAALRAELGVPEGAMLFLSPRALSRRYGHEAILRAFRILCGKAGSPAYLVFKRYGVANDGLVEELQSSAAGAGLADRVRFAPEIAYERLPVLYAASDAVVNFPDQDAFPVTFIEALACERPVITKDLPAYGTYAIRRHLDVVREPGDAGLADAMLEAMGNRGLRGGRMAEARADAVAIFDEEAVAGRLKEAYESLLRPAPAKGA